MLSKEDKIKEWNMLIERYISLHKYLRDVGKAWISEGKSGSVSAGIQIKLGETLTQSDKALSQLKSFFKPHLTSLDTTDMFVEDKLKSEVRSLREENSKLKHDNNYVLQLNEEYKNGHNPDLLNKLGQAQQILDRERQSFISEKQVLEDKVRKLEEHCELLMQEIQPSGENFSTELHTIFRRKQLQSDETLKAQNELIEDLKQRLFDSNRDREILRTLNRSLETELKKNYTFRDFEDFVPEGSADTTRSTSPIEQKDSKHEPLQKIGNDLQTNLNLDELENGPEKQIFKDDLLHPTENKQVIQYEYTDLQQQLQKLQLQNEDLQSCLRAYYVKMGRCASKHSKREPSLETRSEVLQITTDLKQSQEKVVALEQENCALKERLDEQQREKRDGLFAVKGQQGKFRCVSVEDQLYILKEDVNAWDTRQQDQLQRKATILESQLSQYHNEVQRLNLQLNQTKEELNQKNAFQITNEYSDRSNQKFHQYEAQIKYLLEQQQQERAKNEHTNFEYEKQLDKLQNEKEKLSQQLLQVEANFENNYKEYITTLKRANQELHQHLSTLNQERDFLQIQNQDFSTEIQKLNVQVSQLSEKLSKKHDLVDSSSSLNRELQARESEIKNFWEQFQQQQKENEFLKSTLSDYDKHLHMLNNQKKTLSQQEKAHFEKLLFTCKDEATRMQELINQLKQRLSNSNQERDSLQIKHDNLLKIIQEVQMNTNRPSSMIQQSSSLDKKQSSFTNQVENQTDETKEDYTYVRKTLNKIEEIKKDVEDINKQVEKFSGTQEDREFLHLKEMLIRNVLKLDNIEAEGNNIIRQHRKDMIKRVHEVLGVLIDKCPS